MEIVIYTILLFFSAFRNNAEEYDNIYTFGDFAYFQNADVPKSNVLDVNSDLCRRIKSGKGFADGRSNAINEGSLHSIFDSAAYCMGLKGNTYSYNFKSHSSIYQLQSIRI
ncbi:MAG: hypothetical protein RR363_05165 [Rikenellaceae bacterium]